eukprot:548634-Prymnesium_polylepis.1
MKAVIHPLLAPRSTARQGRLVGRDAHPKRNDVMTSCTCLSMMRSACGRVAMQHIAVVAVQIASRRLGLHHEVDGARRPARQERVRAV